MHPPNPPRRPLLILDRLPRLWRALAPTLPAARLVLVPKLRALHAHARRGLADAQLRVVEHRDRELDALRAEVHDERVARERPVLPRVQLHLRPPAVVLLEQPEPAEARRELVRVRVRRQARHVHRRVLRLPLRRAGRGRAAAATRGGGGGRGGGGVLTALGTGPEVGPICGLFALLVDAFEHGCSGGLRTRACGAGGQVGVCAT